MELEVLFSSISGIFLSGTIGYISYFILQETAGIYFSARVKDEKRAMIALLSFVTFLVIYITYYSLSFVIEKQFDLYFWSFILASIIMIILNFYLFPKLTDFADKIINKKRIENNLAALGKNSKRRNFFEEEANRFIYMFTLKGEYITSGTLHSTTLESDMYQEYILLSGSETSVRTIKEIEETYDKNKQFEIFIDIENNLQIYVDKS